MSVNLVRQLREKGTVTQRQLADRAGTSQSTIAAYEAGTKSPTLRTLQRFSRVLGLELVADFLPALSREDARSLAYHNAVVGKLRRDAPTMITTARSNLDRFRRQHPHVDALWSRWDAVLDLPVEELIEMLQSKSEAARDMRQVSPFAGVLTPRERADVLQAFRRTLDHES